MNNTERKQFEDELAVLFGGFPQFLTPPRIEAYWRGLARMPLAVFRRCVDQALGESGLEKLPTVNTLWQISRTLRATAPSSQQAQQPSQFDDYHCLGQKWLLGFIVQRAINDKPTLTEWQLQECIRQKNQIVEQFRASGDIEGNVAEWFDVAAAAFERTAA